MNDLILTEKLWLKMLFEANLKGYSSTEFLECENIGSYYYTGGYGIIRFNTPELKTFYALRWS